MASGKSTTESNKVLDAQLGAVAYTAPATVYIGLWAAASLSAGSTGSTAGEVSTTSTGYARVAVTNNTTNWPAAASGSKSNANAINFPSPTASWGTVGQVAICDAAAAGNILYWGDLSSAQTINTGNTVSFAANALTVTEA